MEEIKISQTVAVLVDGNNIERSIQAESFDNTSMLNFDKLIPHILANRALNRFIYFREGKNISSKLAERLHTHFHGSVRPCHKSADIPLSITATQLSSKVDTIIILSGDSDYIELVRHLKSEGVRVEIAAVESTTAQILRDEADYFHPITSEHWFIYSGAGRSHGGRRSAQKTKAVPEEKKADSHIKKLKTPPKKKKPEPVSPGKESSIKPS